MSSSSLPSTIYPRYPFTDTHCHIHDSEFFPDGGEAQYQRALEAGIGRMLCVGTDVRSSVQAVAFADRYAAAWAVVGIHPHDATVGRSAVDELATLLGSTQKSDKKVVGVGEIGLDYYYDNSPREAQRDMLHAQLELAQKHALPVSFHVREAFADFWPIFDEYDGLRGVLHSYTDDLVNLEKGLSRGLFVGVNGIATFAKGRDEITKAIPLDKLLLETDAPFLTPTPLRGTVNEPAFVTHVARYVAELHTISPQELSRITEKNATKLFF